MKEYDVPAEINTASLNKKAYKSSDLMRLLSLIARFDLPVLINDDAHHVLQLGQNYETVFNAAKSRGIKKFCRPIKNKTGFLLEKFSIENQR